MIMDFNKFSRMKFLLVILLALVVTPGFSENIYLSKAGQLKKELKKKKNSDLSTLELSGFINSKDLKTMSELPNLKNLKLLNISYAPGKKEMVGHFCLPNLPTLEKLIIYPQDDANWEIDLSGLPNLRYLQSPISNSFVGCVPEVLDTVYLTESELSGGLKDKTIVKTLITDKQVLNFKNILPLGSVLTYKINDGNHYGRVLSTYSNRFSNLIKECEVIGTGSLRAYTDTVFYLPDNIKWIEEGAFSNSKIKNLILSDKSGLRRQNKKIQIPSNITVMVPMGGYYKNLAFFSSPIYEIGIPHTYTYDSRKDGFLNTFLDSDIAEKIDTLIIGGTITENDFLSLNHLSNLRVLDIRNANILKLRNVIEKEKYDIVKDYIGKIQAITVDNIKKVQDSYYTRQVGLNLLSEVFGYASEAADAKGTLSGKVEKKVYDNMESQLRSELNSLTSPQQVIELMIAKYGEVIDEIASYYDNVDLIIYELEKEDITGESWQLIENPKPVIDKLDSVISNEFWRNLYNSKNNIAELLTKSDPINDYKLSWVNNKTFKLYKKRKKLNLGFDNIYVIEKELKDKIKNVPIYSSVLPSKIIGIKNLKLVIVDDRIKNIPETIKNEKRIKVLCIGK